MKAREAREKANAVESKAYQDQYALIMEKIKLAATKGKYLINFGDNLRSDVKSQLESEGYLVKYSQSGINEYENRISW